MARYMRTDLGRGHTLLRPPVVVTAAAVPLARPIQVELADRQNQARITVTRRGTHSRLRPPAVVAGGIAWHGPGVYLTRLRPTPPTTSLLRPGLVEEPVVAIISYGPEVHLTRIRPPEVYPDLGRVLVLDAPGQALGWIGIQLAPSRRGQAKVLPAKADRCPGSRGGGVLRPGGHAHSQAHSCRPQRPASRDHSAARTAA